MACDDLPWPAQLRVTRLPDHAPDLTESVEDWEVLIELSKRGGVDGFITNDLHILLQPREMVALSRTHLALVVTDGVGHEPLRATGLVMVHREEIAKRLDGTPFAFVLKPGQINQRGPNQHLNRIAELRNVSAGDLFGTEIPYIQARLG